MQLSQLKRTVSLTRYSYLAPRHRRSLTPSRSLLPGRALHSFSILPHFPACRCHRRRASHRVVVPDLPPQAAKRTLSSPFQTILSFSESFDNPSSIFRAHESASSMAHIFRPFTTITSSLGKAPPSQQTSKISVWIFSPPNPSILKKTTPTTTTSALSELLLSPPSHQRHPALTFLTRQPKPHFPS